MNKQQAYYAKKYKQRGRAGWRYIYDGIWFDEELNRFVDINRSQPEYGRYLKRQCNKKVRAMKFESSTHPSYYRKCTEFWWILT